LFLVLAFALATPLSWYSWGAPSPRAYDVEPPGGDLPLELPANWLESSGFIPFPPHPPVEGHAVRAPIAVRIILDGKVVSPFLQGPLVEIFDESFLVSIPAEESIRVESDAQGREAWVYPTGTVLAHRTWLKNPTPEYSGETALVELRVEKKMAKNRWAFGIYSPGRPGFLKLNDEGSDPRRDFQALGSAGSILRLTLTRLPMQTCRHCHQSTSPAAYQYADEEATGPCGFVPGHTELRGSWADQYERQTGARPFSGP
jgi:hypothetical protein